MSQDIESCPQCGADDYETHRPHWADGVAPFKPFCECRCGATWDEDRPIAQPAVPEGWQPIETAPKDFCTEFDGWNGKRVPDVYWAKPEFNSKGNYAWCVQQYEHGYGSVNIEVNGLTHWRPIPAAPEKGQP